MTHEFLDERYSGIRNIGDAYDEGKLKLNELAVIYTKKTPLFMIENWLNGLLVYLNFDAQREDYQMSQLAKYIYEDLHFMNLQEITLFFRYVKRGKYGEFYGKIDPVKMLIWCREFRQERGNYISKLPVEFESEVVRKAKEEYYRSVTSPPSSSEDTN
jgi:hypothetical protein